MASLEKLVRPAAQMILESPVAEIDGDSWTRVRLIGALWAGS